ncbi:hypothetical protein ADL27_10550 [Streptomyces sp. NRRL F-6602]|nr:hypothetical protein ADL27_10550 [Streptomyces sp. NRRL F-6602]
MISRLSALCCHSTHSRAAISSAGSTGHSGIRQAARCLKFSRRAARAPSATKTYIPATATPVTSLRTSRLTKHRTAPGTPTTRVATQGEPKRAPSREKARLTGVGQAASRAEAKTTREFWMTMTIAALTMASAMQRLMNVPTVELLHCCTMPAMSPPARECRSGAPRVIATTGTKTMVKPMPRVHSTVRETVRRGFSISSARYTAVVKPWRMKSAVASPVTIRPAVTGSVWPWPPSMTGWRSTEAGRWVWVKPRKATMPAPTTSSARKMPVIQALARRSSRPMAVDSSMTAAAANRGSRSTTGAR